LTEASQATLIVTLSTTDDFEVTRRRILQVKGVRSVYLDYTSQKLRVRYYGDSESSAKILAAIREIIASHVE
jgi:hypothetical protein